jgi:hypothetical protein
MEGENGRELHELLQRAWQDKYGPRGQGPSTAPEMKKSRTTLQTPLLAAGAFTAALAGVPAEDWCRTWPADTTIMLRETSKTAKQTVDKMRLPADVRLSRSFWREHQNLTDAEKSIEGHTHTNHVNTNIQTRPNTHTVTHTHTHTRTYRQGPPGNIDTPRKKSIDPWVEWCA